MAIIAEIGDWIKKPHWDEWFKVSSIGLDSVGLLNPETGTAVVYRKDSEWEVMSSEERGLRDAMDVFERLGVYRSGTGKYSFGDGGHKAHYDSRDAILKTMFCPKTRELDALYKQIAKLNKQANELKKEIYNAK